MKRFLHIFFLLSSLAILFSCSTTRGYVKSKTTQSKPDDFTVIQADYNSVLFKIKISAFGNDYSGLLLLKNQTEENAKRIVYLSEFGLNLIDLRYRNDSMQVVDVKDFLNKPQMLGVLSDDFRMLVQDMSRIKDYLVFNSKKDNSKVLRFKSDSQKYFYFWQPEQGISLIKRKAGISRSAKMEVYGKESAVPDSVLIDHKFLNLKIKLKKLSVK